MHPLLKNFRTTFRKQLLDLLWRQWSSMGVSGYSGEAESRLIDPEALLLFTFTVGRHESRLFDEVLDWIDLNGRFISIQRLKNIMRKEPYQGIDVAAAVAGIMSKRASMAKWKRLSLEAGKAEDVKDLFFDSDGQPMPLFGEPDGHFLKYGLRRGKLSFQGRSSAFNPSLKCNLVLKLRALLGVNARSEILAYLVTHDSGHPSQIAREVFYFPKTVQDALVEMTRSGLIHVRRSNREKHYWLNPAQWALLLNTEKELPVWIQWPALFRALKEVWLTINDARLSDLDPLLLSSELRELVRRVRDPIEGAGFAPTLSDDSAYHGEEYIEVFITDLERLAARLLE